VYNYKIVIAVGLLVGLVVFLFLFLMVGRVVVLLLWGWRNRGWLVEVGVVCGCCIVYYVRIGLFEELVGFYCWLLYDLFFRSCFGLFYGCSYSLCCSLCFRVFVNLGTLLIKVTSWSVWGIV
jgi:hypothetical protein